MIGLDQALNELVIANRILANENVMDAYGHVSVRHPANPERFFMAQMLAAPEIVVVAPPHAAGTVDEVEGSFKMNQHKSDVDHAAVANELARQPDTAAREFAQAMRAMRPQAFANEPTPSIASAAVEGNTP